MLQCDFLEMTVFSASIASTAAGFAFALSLIVFVSQVIFMYFTKGPVSIERIFDMKHEETEYGPWAWRPCPLASN